MSKTEVILTSSVENLGAESDHVSVAAGYARNYLIPQGLAVPVTRANKRRLEVLKQRRVEREADELTTANELSKSLSKMVLPLKVRTGDDGKMFGSVTAANIADELKAQFDIDLDKRKIHLEEPIRIIGDYEAELRLHPEVDAKLKIHVESLSGVTLPEPEEAVESEKDKEKDGDKDRRRDKDKEKEKDKGPEKAKDEPAPAAAEAKG